MNHKMKDRKSNPWKVLGLKDTANTEELKRQYKRLAATFHPDKGGNPEQFRYITDAYDEAKQLIATRKIEVNVDIISSPKELISLLGQNVVISYNDIEFEILIPYETRVGDSIRIHNIIDNTDLIVKIKDRYEQSR